MEIVKYEQAFMFAYSLREKTHAHRNYVYLQWLFFIKFIRDDVPEEMKQRRLKEMIDTFNTNAAINSSKELNKEYLVLVEGVNLSHL